MQTILFEHQKKLFDQALRFHPFFTYLIKHIFFSQLFIEAFIIPSHAWLIIMIRFITLKNNWVNPWMKTEENVMNK